MRSTEEQGAYTRYWAMRTDRQQRDFIASELAQGRLRQGWGWSYELDLRNLRDAPRENLSPDQLDVWSKNRRLLVGDSDAVQIGDRVVVPHVSDRGHWLIAEVSDGYEFELAADGPPDYGHVIHVTPLVEGASKHHPAVSADLRSSFKCRRRLWSLDRFQDEIEALIASEDPLRASAELDRLESVRSASYDAALKRLAQHFGDADFESPVKQILEAAFGASVEHTGGPTEQGADLCCSYRDALGTDHVAVVQVKAYTGTTSPEVLRRALEQLERARDAYEGTTSAVVFTLLDSIPEESLKDAKDLESRLRIPVRLFAAPDVVALFVRYLPDVLGEAEGGATGP